MMIPKIYLRVALLLFLGFMLWGFTTVALAQDNLPKGYRVLWPANPVEENIGWYIVSASATGTGEYTKVIDTDGRTGNASSCETNTFDDTIPEGYDGHCIYYGEISRLPLPRDLVAGDEVCINVVAARGNERSSPSRPVCFAYLPQNGNSGLPEPEVPGSPVNLSAPQQPVIFLVY